MRPPKLSEPEAAAALAGMTGWTMSEGRLAKRFAFRDFSAAFGWMTRVALAAETMNHHPEWTNVYRTVEVRLSTHDAGGLTALDFELARRMDGLAA